MCDGSNRCVTLTRNLFIPSRVVSEGKVLLGAQGEGKSFLPSVESLLEKFSFTNIYFMCFKSFSSSVPSRVLFQRATSILFEGQISSFTS